MVTTSKRAGVLIVILFFHTSVALGGDRNNVTATNEMNTRAKAEFSKGVLFYNAEKFDDAARAFRKAYELKPSWMLHFNIAQSEAAAKQYGRSFEEFEKYLAKGGDEVSQQRQTYVESELERLEGLVGSIEVSGPDGAGLLIDGIERGTLPIHRRVKLAVGTIHDVAVILNHETIFTKKIQLSRGEIIQLNTEPSGSSASTLEDTSTVAHGDGVAAVGLSGFAADSQEPPERRKLSPVFWTGLVGTVLSGVATGVMWGSSFKKQQEELDAKNEYDAASGDWVAGDEDDAAEKAALAEKHRILGDELETRRNVAIGLTVTTGAFLFLTTIGIVVSAKKGRTHGGGAVAVVPGGLEVRF